ncbi:MAG: TetR/AcrR family transcriptional regulator [Desulfobacteraceae bacterium]|nr:TetR/AcrR family transcriptional regulator [Desulfobacteraceae bacterium]
MQKHSEGQNPQAVLKKFAKARSRAGMVEALIGSRAAGTPTPELLAEELARCFLSMQNALRSGPPHGKAMASKLIDAFAEAASSNGIPPDRFFPAILERILLEDTEDTTRLASKLGTKERILEAALEVFAQKGFHSATTDEIAERAGVGKGTLYRYFETKETLFQELVRLRLDELERKIVAANDGHDDVLTMISKHIRIYFEFFDRNQHLYRLVVQEQLDLGEQAPNMYFRKVMRALPGLKRKVYEGSQQGILKDVDFQTVFYGTMGFVHGVIQKWLARDCSYPLVEELPSVLEVLFFGFVKDARKIECED